MQTICLTPSTTQFADAADLVSGTASPPVGPDGEGAEDVGNL